MSFVKVQGIVIKSKNINDSDKIITLLSDKLGKVDVVANGCRKPKSRFMSSTQMFCYGEYVINKGRSLHVLKESNILESFQGLILDLDKLAYGSYFLELVDSLVEKDMKNIQMLALTLKTLYILLHNEGSLPLLKVVFDFKAISIAGFMPEVLKCINCKSTEGPFVFSTPSGGIICKNCNKENDLLLSKDETKFLQDIRNIKLENINTLNVNFKTLNSVQSIITFYIRNYIERDFKSLQLLKTLS